MAGIRVLLVFSSFGLIRDVRLVGEPDDSAMQFLEVV